jgi:thiamine-monophosphate kinase
VDGEFALIARLREILETDVGSGPAEVVIGSGDDAAVTVPPGATATSVDALIEGVHFRRETFPLRSVGHKALASALSDLAAMGATPGEAYVQLGVPEGLSQAEAEELAEGLAACARATQTRVLGGDVTMAPALMVAVTVVGHAPGSQDLVSRAGAQPGDELIVTGPLGGAAAGLLLLSDRELAERLPGELRRELTARQLEPLPRIAAGRVLAASGATAMIDLSDGLASDAAHIAEASAVGLMVELDEIPKQEGVAEVAAAAGRDPLELTAAGGEDYELLAAVPAQAVEAALAALANSGAAPAVIGTVEAGSGLSLVDQEGAARSELRGFDQLRGSRSPGELA